MTCKKPGRHNPAACLLILRTAGHKIPTAMNHILIVDDEASIRDLLSEFFRKRGYKVSTASNPAEALALTDSVPIQLVILDVLLEEADGMEVLQSVKDKHPNLPVVIMTGIGFDEELFKEAREKGAAGYVSKTLPLDQLLMEVHRVLKQYR